MIPIRHILMCCAAILLVAASVFSATPARAADDDAKWTVLFRSDDPMKFHHDNGKRSDANGYSIKLTNAPEGIRYLRLKRMDTGDAVILALNNDQLTKSGLVDDHFIWNGNALVRGPQGNKNLLLGIADQNWPAQGKHLVSRMPRQMDTGYRGWGFSKAQTSDPTQTYSWAGEEIKKTIFEIAVKTSDLTDDERAHLLSGKTNVTEDKPKAQPEEGLTTAGPTTRPARTQSTIKALWIKEHSDGQMIGFASDLILTATPGTPPGNHVPITFATRVGSESHLVLEDVVRALNAKYPHIAAQKLELSFQDKFTPKDGPSIGAAVGTLMLSIIQGFEIDPKIAMTGDVTADARVHRIGGVWAKLRGAAADGCAMVAIPMENNDQLVDILVYDGSATILNVQVFGIANLDDAAAFARLDRDSKFSQAAELFASVQQVLKKSPQQIHTKDVQEKLKSVIDLAPNHLSAKTLLLAAEDKQPKRLSPFATIYYTDIAVRTISPMLAARAKKAGQPQISSSVVNNGLRTLDRIHRLSDPAVLPLVDAWSNYLRALNDVEANGASVKILDPKWDAVQEAIAKFNSDRDLQEKLIREGI